MLNFLYGLERKIVFNACWNNSLLEILKRNSHSGIRLPVLSVLHLFTIYSKMGIKKVDQKFGTKSSLLFVRC